MHRSMDATGAGGQEGTTGAYLEQFVLEGTPGGPLTGLTVAVKDLFHVRPACCAVLCCSSAALLHPSRTCTLARRLPVHHPALLPHAIPVKARPGAHTANRAMSTSSTATAVLHQACTLSSCSTPVPLRRPAAKACSPAHTTSHML